MKKIFDLVGDYFKSLEDKKVILLDYDGTMVIESWPYIGDILPGCIEVINELIKNGHKIIFYTQRNSRYLLTCQRLLDFYNEFPCYQEETQEGRECVDILTPAKQQLIENGITFWDTNRNYHWEWCTGDNGRKIFCDYIIDDHCVGMKYNVYINKYGEQVKCCDWKFIDQWFVNEGLYNKCVL